MSLNSLFEGFDQFVDGCLMGVFWNILCFVLCLPMLVVVVVGLGVLSQGGPVATGVGIAVMTFAFLAFNLIVGLMMVGVVFSAGLIVEFKAGFTDAFLYSLKGIRTNFFGLALLVQVSTLLHVTALMMCIVPAFLVLPIITAGHFLAYKKIFGVPMAKNPMADPAVGQYR